ncbi:ArsR/SmtB family transcription factor [Nonomuraea soli]|uniref:DNA-binding transcriptional ArsR family regulator n=1 Tax=Nonomuraea soli TaxID=1032476 RepID=A0A7W0CJW4_9ACTN|nr:winged helix-turn-helix domain-containing protein [Nonomuraea soli]MBA2892500.1 DNA-binding transcriptional ArsR family regulator [Nonomuraea soli]
MEQTRRHLGPDDVGTLKAMAHPTRVRLLMAVAEIGPATVGMLAARVGEAVGAVSYHLQQLGQHGLVAEAPELARDKRERWWRFVPTDSLSMTPSDFAGDPVGQHTQRAALLAWVDAAAERNRRSVEAMHSLPQEWQDVTLPSVNGPMELTADELRQFYDDFNELIEQWRERGRAAADPADDRRRVNVYIQPMVYPPAS